MSAFVRRRTETNPAPACRWVLVRRKYLRREPAVQSDVIETGADLLRRSARSDTDGQRNRGQRLLDVGCGFQRSRKQPENLGIYLGMEVVRQPAAQLRFNFESCLPHRAAEETIEHLIRRNRIAVTSQGVG